MEGRGEETGEGGHMSKIRLNGISKINAKSLKSIRVHMQTL